MKRFDDGLAPMLKLENVAYYTEGKVRILDRRIYPIEVKFVECKTVIEVRDAIRNMVTQSAGPYTACGMGMALAAYETRFLSKEDRRKKMKEAGELLSNARPTTVSRMKQVVEGCLMAMDKEKDWTNLDKALCQHTISSMENRYNKIDLVSSYLIELFPNKATIMTQCFGETIIGMMGRRANEVEKKLKFVCPETRPFLQGARFTASVLSDMGFDVTVITDNMVASYIEEKGVSIFTSAADSINLDGSVINKVGTHQIAIVSKYFGIPYFVTGIPDLQSKSANDVIIEMRDPEESLSAHHIKHTKEKVQGYYPAFDITPPHLVSGVVTDIGVYSPYDLVSYEKKIKESGFYNFAV